MCLIANQNQHLTHLSYIYQPTLWQTGDTSSDWLAGNRKCCRVEAGEGEWSDLSVPPWMHQRPLSVRQQPLLHHQPPCVTPLSLLLLPPCFHTWTPTWVRGGGWSTAICALITPSLPAASRPTGKTFLTAFFRHFFALAEEWGRNLGINFWSCEEAGGFGVQTNYWRLAHNEALKLRRGPKPRQQNTTSLDARTAERPILLLLPSSMIRQKALGHKSEWIFESL